MNQDELLRLIDAIYGAAADFTQWPGVLTQIADAFGAQEASLSSVNGAAVPWLVAPRSDPEFLQSYAAHYHPLNRFWRHASRLPVGTVATDRMVIAKEELRASEFYNDWSKPQGYLAVMGATLLVEDGWRTEFVVPGKRDFGEEHLKLYAALAPHLVRAIQLNQRLARADADRTATAAALDRLHQGALLVDGQARVLFANRAVETIFAGGGLRLRNGLLRACENADTAALQAAVAACVEGVADACGGYISVARGEDKHPLSLLVIPMPHPVTWLTQQPAAIIFIADPDTRAIPPATQLQSQFRLTSAESRFVIELLQGDGVASVAERLGIKVGTARTHLHRVLAKTGTRRQAELVRLVLASRHTAGR